MNTAEIYPIEKAPEAIAYIVKDYARTNPCSTVYVVSGCFVQNQSSKPTLDRGVAFITELLETMLRKTGYGIARDTAQPNPSTTALSSTQQRVPLDPIPEVVIYFALVDSADSETASLSFWLTTYPDYLQSGVFENRINNTTILTKMHLPDNTGAEG